MNRWKKIGIILVSSIVAITLFIFLLLRSWVPDYSGKVTEFPVSAEVEVVFDEHAIPHIYAANEEDAWTTLGYLTARERLFQMEVIRRLASGRLSEIFGDRALDADRFFRTLSLSQFAREVSERMHNKQSQTPFYKASMAYLKGVNKYIETGNKPIEFRLAGIPMDTFSLYDCELIMSYMAFTFMEGFHVDGLYQWVHENLGADYLKDIDPNLEKDEAKIAVQHAGIIPKDTSNVMMDLTFHLDKINQGLPFHPLLGSNAWLLSGSKTKSGKPIFANDTHIAFSQPSVWYEANIHVPNLNFYGNFLPGMPMAILGHNDQIAWGFTMFLNDEVDFYKEKTSPENRNLIYRKGEWQELEQRTEVIKVKDSSPDTIIVRSSDHGPIVSDVLGALGKQSPFWGVEEPVSLFWTYQKFSSTLLEQSYRMAHTTNVDEMKDIASNIHSPGLNLMYADVNGNIAWWASGKLIDRPKHVNSHLLLDGTGPDDPLGWLDFSKNPQNVNPENGMIYTANNAHEAVNGQIYPGYYYQGDRAGRIKSLLEAKSDWTIEDVAKMQGDDVDVEARNQVQLLMKSLESDVKISSPLWKPAVEILKNWNGSHGLEEVAPTLYYRFLYRLYENVLADEMEPKVFQKMELNRLTERMQMNIFKDPTSPWWDNVNTPAIESMDEMVVQSLGIALEDLQKQLGGVPSSWHWSKVHTLQHNHALGTVPYIGKYFNVGGKPIAGGKSTINKLSFNIDSSGLYKVTSGPALRRVIDFSKPLEGISINPSGQSGYFFSKYYDDQYENFVNNVHRPEHMTKESAKKSSIGTMRFLPNKKG